MKPLPSRLRRLDDALADLPLDEPMLLTELDGFLTGVLLCPEPIPQAEWLQGVWGIDDGSAPPFEDPLDVQWFVDAITARCTEIVRDLSRGKPQPLFDIDERNGDVLWELWIDGFAEAMALRPAIWATLAAGEDDVADALAQVSVLIGIARNDTSLDSLAINDLEVRAHTDLVDLIARLHGAGMRAGSAALAMPIKTIPTRIGRNDPCRCGSGKKSKRCCG
jgi:uncharacterized protein